MLTLRTNLLEFTFTIFGDSPTLSQNLSLKLMICHLAFYLSKIDDSLNLSPNLSLNLLIHSVCHKIGTKKLQLFIGTLILGSYYKLNWPKGASAVYWLLGTLPYPCQIGH